MFLLLVAEMVTDLFECSCCLLQRWLLICLNVLVAGMVTDLFECSCCRDGYWSV